MQPVVFLLLKNVYCEIRITTAHRTMGSFRNTKWDPILLITQIVAMQSLLYASLGALMCVHIYPPGACTDIELILADPILTNSPFQVVYGFTGRS